MLIWQFSHYHKKSNKETKQPFNFVINLPRLRKAYNFPPVRVFLRAVILPSFLPTLLLLWPAGFQTTKICDSPPRCLNVYTWSVMLLTAAAMVTRTTAAIQGSSSVVLGYTCSTRGIGAPSSYDVNSGASNALTNSMTCGPCAQNDADGATLPTSKGTA